VNECAAGPQSRKDRVRIGCRYDRWQGLR